MERNGGMLVRSDIAGGEAHAIGEEPFQFREEVHGNPFMMIGPSEPGSSFTALLELPANQAMKLLHSPESGESPTATRSIPSNSSANHKPKNEPADTESYPNSFPPLVSPPTVQNQGQKSAKRKEREKKGALRNQVKGPTKKSKNVRNESSGGDAEKLPYVHVRARRGQATDSHSLAERVRREKISARMKLLQELVPGCNKITGTALVLDEIINHVQSLQRQVEFLSMRLAAVNPRIDFNLDSLLAAENGSHMGSNFPSMVMPFMWPDFQLNDNRQQYQPLWHMDALHLPVWGRGEDNHNFVVPENSLLSYDDSANSVSLHSNPLKMEL